MAFGPIIIGDEILSGKRSDKQLPKVIELLGERGVQPARASTRPRTCCPSGWSNSRKEPL